MLLRLPINGYIAPKSLIDRSIHDNVVFMKGIYYVLLLFGACCLNSCAFMSKMGFYNPASWDKKETGVAALQEDLVWKNAKSANNQDTYRSYLEQFPNGKFKYEARLQLQLMEADDAWARTLTTGTEEAYTLFMRDYSGSKYNAQAYEKLAQIRQKETWSRVMGINSSEAYTQFINRFPSSPYLPEASKKLADVKSEEEWTRIKNFNASNPFEQYLKTFPGSRHVAEAKAKILSLQSQDFSRAPVIAYSERSSNRSKAASPPPAVPTEPRRPAEPKEDLGEERYLAAEIANTPIAYQTFLKDFPRHKYALNARRQLAVFDEQAWMRIKGSSVKSDFENYLKDFPDGRYVREAKKKSIDQEVATILAGDYQALPGLNRKEVTPGAKLNEITIKNITGFNLVILYSGPVSERVEVPDGATLVVKLPNGSYQITASLNSDLIGNFVGKENLTGGKYETKFFLGY